MNWPGFMGPISPTTCLLSFSADAWKARTSKRLARWKTTLQSRNPTSSAGSKRTSTPFAPSALEWEMALFLQRKRVVDAERSLQTKVTRKAREDIRIGHKKIADYLDRLADARRSEPKKRDSRIFPMVYAPVIAEIDGGLQIVPIGYGCRLAGKPAHYDVRYPGTYNARRDNWTGSGVRSLAAITRPWSSAASLRMSPRTGMSVANSNPASRKRTRSWNSSRNRLETCGWRASGIIGRRRVNRICCHLRQSPTSRLRKLRRQVTRDV